MAQSPSRKMSIGACLAVLGGIGMSLAPSTGATQLAIPWSFLAGLLVGLSAGAGAALTVGGLIERRHQES
jgi:hypothetical protein